MSISSRWIPLSLSCSRSSSRSRVRALRLSRFHTLSHTRCHSLSRSPYLALPLAVNGLMRMAYPLHLGPPSRSLALSLLLSRSRSRSHSY